MLAGFAAVAQNFGFLASGILQGIGQDWQSIKSPLRVDGPGNPQYGRGQPGRRDGHWMKGVAEDVTKKSGLDSTLASVRLTIGSSVSRTTRHGSSSLVGVIGGYLLSGVGGFGRCISGTQSTEVRGRSWYFNNDLTSSIKGSQSIQTSLAQCPQITLPLGKFFGDLDGTTTPLVTKPSPDAAATGNAKKP